MKTNNCLLCGETPLPESCYCEECIDSGCADGVERLEEVVDAEIAAMMALRERAGF